MIKDIVYTIHDRSEETDCDYCGRELNIGDEAIEAAVGIFCSEGCAESWRTAL